jgi:hypothetical protein
VVYVELELEHLRMG